MRFPRIALQNGPAGGHVESGCVDGVHRSADVGKHGKKDPIRRCEVPKIAKAYGGELRHRLALESKNQPLQNVNANVNG